MGLNPAVLKAALGLLALSLAGYIVGPPLYWHFMEGLAAVSSHSSSCPACTCDCSSQPLLSIPQGLSNTSFAAYFVNPKIIKPSILLRNIALSPADCAKHDPEVSEDTEKNFTELLSEELKLRETESSESQQRADMALLEAKKMTSQYQKEADKCNSGMETCEEAREKAEATLLAQKKLTSMWELRARQKGWKEGAAKSRTQSQGNVQTA
ncbi:hypothetical protein LguiA_035280 [Lonicera macranthoides]